MQYFYFLFSVIFIEFFALNNFSSTLSWFMTAKVDSFMNVPHFGFVRDLWEAQSSAQLWGFFSKKVRLLSGFAASCAALSESAVGRLRPDDAAWHLSSDSLWTQLRLSFDVTCFRPRAPGVSEWLFFFFYTWMSRPRHRQSPKCKSEPQSPFTVPEKKGTCFSLLDWRWPTWMRQEAVQLSVTPMFIYKLCMQALWH